MSGWLIAGMAVMVIAGAAEAKQQREAGKANQAIAENNARLADDAARDANVQGARESQKAAWRMRNLRGQQMAAIAANGIDSGLGSASDILDETATLGAADRSAIGLDAARKAWGFQGEATNHRNQGKQARWMGNTSSNITILKTIGSAMSAYGGGAGGGSRAASTSTTRSYSSFIPSQMGTGY